MSVRNAWLAVLLCGLPCACAVGPDYQRPALQLPAAYGEAMDTSTADALIERSWWKAFKDPTLDQLVDQALRDNNDLRLAAARVEEASGAKREAGAARLPEIGLAANSSRTSVSQTTATPLPAIYPVQQPDHKINLSTAFELDFWGRLSRADEAARAQELASRYGRATVEITLVAAVAQSYLSLRSFDAQISVAQNSLDARKASLAIAESRLRGGLASDLDVQQARAAAAAIAAQLTDLRQQRAQAEHQLALLCATPDLKIAPGDLRSLPLPPLPPAGLPSALLEARPDILQAEAQLMAANARIGVAKAALFPTIALTGSVGSESMELSGLFQSNSSIWSLGLGLKAAVFDGGLRAARVDQATAQQQQALAAYQKSIQTGFKEVRDALVAGRERALGEEALTVQEQAATRGLELARKRYEVGYSPYLEVLDGQRSANDAALARIRNRQLRLVAAVDLFRALGGGWKESAP